MKKRMENFALKIKIWRLETHAKQIQVWRKRDKKISKSRVGCNQRVVLPDNDTKNYQNVAYYGTISPIFSIFAQVT